MGLRTAKTEALSGGGPDPRIGRFIGRHRVLTLATGSADAGGLWCCNVFYAFLPADKLTGLDCVPALCGGAFVFTSPAETEHARMFLEHPQVAGSVVLESRVVGRLQGLQFRGVVVRADTSPELLAAARGVYLKRFPFATPMLSDLWVLSLSRLKFTDNTLGFGTKLLWP